MVDRAQDKKISVDASAFDDEEELIEIGKPAAGERGAQNVDAPSFEAGEALGASQDGVGGSGFGGGRRDDGLRYEDTETDYSVDDLAPMPLTQKIVLFVLVAAVIVGAAWIFNYYFGYTG